MTEGPYRWIRHPAYAGYLLTLAGIAVAADDLIASTTLIVPNLLAVLYRVRVEERTLVTILGQRYADYQRATWRLLPLVF